MVLDGLIDESTAEEYAAGGMKRFEAGELEEGIELLQKALEHPVAANAGVANYFAEIGLDQGAIVNYCHALGQGYNEAFLFSHVGSVLFRREEWARAAKQLERAIEREPHMTISWYILLCECHSRMGGWVYANSVWVEAMESADRILEANRGKPGYEKEVKYKKMLESIGGNLVIS